MTPKKSSPPEWLDRYGDTLYRFAMLRLEDPHIAEDLVQETLLAALNARDRFAGNATEKTWMIGILKHKIVDHFRKASREQVLHIEEIDHEPETEPCFDERGRWTIDAGAWVSPEKSLEQDQFWVALADCVGRLPKRLGRLFVLREIDGMGSEDILEILNISTANNLWVMLSRMRLKLRNCLDDRWFADERS